MCLLNLCRDLIVQNSSIMQAPTNNLDCKKLTREFAILSSCLSSSRESSLSCSNLSVCFKSVWKENRE